MAGDAIDSMIENFVGSVRQNTEVKDKEQGSLSGFSLKEKEYPKDDSGAAKLLREKALLGWEKAFPKARKEPHWTTWGYFVREHLGIARIGKKRLEKIFELAGLGISDEDKMIVNVEESDIVEEGVPDWTEEAFSEEDEEKEEGEGEPAPANPLISRGPVTFPCGHTNWYTEEANEEARAQGMCCAGMKNHANYDWSVRGLMHPVPEKLQKGHSRFIGIPKEAWDGYCCCPHTGLYIGGTSNDCRSNPNGNRCVVHKDASPRIPVGTDIREEFKSV